MMIVHYPSKKVLKENIGKPLIYRETSLFSPEYTPNGKFCASNRPHITGLGREFFAEITMKDGLISKVQ